MYYTRGPDRGVASAIVLAAIDPLPARTGTRARARRRLQDATHSRSRRACIPPSPRFPTFPCLQRSSAKRRVVDGPSHRHGLPRAEIFGALRADPRRVRDLSMCAPCRQTSLSSRKIGGRADGPQATSRTRLGRPAVRPSSSEPVPSGVVQGRTTSSTASACATGLNGCSRSGSVPAARHLPHHHRVVGTRRVVVAAPLSLRHGGLIRPPRVVTSTRPSALGCRVSEKNLLDLQVREAEAAPSRPEGPARSAPPLLRDRTPASSLRSTPQKRHAYRRDDTGSSTRVEPVPPGEAFPIHLRERPA